MMQKSLRKIFYNLTHSLLIILFTSCTNLTPEQKAINKIIIESSTDVMKNYDLHLFGQGESNYRGLHKIKLSYLSNLIPSMGHARELILILCSKTLIKINSDKKLEAISKHYPFSLDNLSIGILFSGVPKTDYESIVMVLMTNDSVTFYSRDPSKPSFRIVHEETFQEAVTIVNQAQINTCTQF